MNDTNCAERHDSCIARMGTNEKDIRTKLPNRAFYIMLIFILGSLSGSYAYTHKVEAKTYENKEKIQQIVTKDDMEKMQKALVEAIKELK